MSSDQLIVEMKDERKKWARSTIVYATLNVAFRLLLILASAIVAAQNNLKESPVSSLVRWVPAFALAVSILTGLDSWLKPRDKWRGFMEDRDDLSDLLIIAQTEQDTNSEHYDNLRKAFKDLRLRHRNKNVY
jgi:hypothetical protein